MEKDIAIGVKAGEKIDPMDPKHWDNEKMADYFIWLLHENKSTRDIEEIMTITIEKLGRR